MISLAVGLGLILNLFFLEVLGVSAGGIVVPGFIALEMSYPTRLISTLAISISVYLIIKLLSNFMLIYGRRHLIMAILIGFLLSEVLSRAPAVFNFLSQFQIIGYILPGIIAYWMERQGVIRTVSTMIICAALIHIILIIITGGKFIV